MMKKFGGTDQEAWSNIMALKRNRTGVTLSSWYSSLDIVAIDTSSKVDVAPG